MGILGCIFQDRDAYPTLRVRDGPVLVREEFGADGPEGSQGQSGGGCY